MPKVAIAMVTDGPIVGTAFKSALSQTYKDTSFLLYVEKRRNLHPDPFINRLKMIAAARNQARKMALATDCEYVFWIDSDTTPGENALELLMEADKDVCCGWYQGADGSGDWVCGWIKDRVVTHPDLVSAGLLRVDFTGLGCALVKRRVLEALEFDCPETVVFGEDGERLATSDASYWTEEANKMGFPVFMHGGVVCRHTVKRKYP
jgi:hypothetical protein